MYCWHTKTASACNRPLIIYSEKVVAGITISFQRFSISAPRADNQDEPSQSRTARSKSAAEEVSRFKINRVASGSLRGIDARSLAARPANLSDPNKSIVSRVQAHRPLIRKVERSYAEPIRPSRDRVLFPSRDRDSLPSRARGSRREERAPNREGRDRGDYDRGRVEEQTPGMDLPQLRSWRAWHYSDEELEYFSERRLGVPTAYIPTTSASLKDHALPMAMSSVPQSMKESILERMRIATRGMNYEQLRHPQEHLDDMSKGMGTVFENDTMRAQTQHWSIRMKTEDPGGGVETKEDLLPFLSIEQQEEVAGEIVGGRYLGPKFAESDDVMGTVRNVLIKNGTYLPADVRRVEEKLSKLLPAKIPTAKVAAA